VTIEDKTAVVSAVPFVQRRRVQWGETDPAGFVYTPRFLDYAVEAVEGWFSATVGYDWFRLNRERGIGSPMAHASLDFLKPLFPAEDFTLTVLVEAIGRSSITLQIAGRNAKGEHCFQAKLVAVLIDPTKLKSRTMPPEFRDKIEAYRQACMTTHRARA